MRHYKKFFVQIRSYKVVFTPDEERPEILNVTVPKLPGCLTFGRGKREAIKYAKEVIDLYLSVSPRKEKRNIK